MMQSKLLMSSEHLYQIIEGYTANVLTVNNTTINCITSCVRNQPVYTGPAEQGGLLGLVPVIFETFTMYQQREKVVSVVSNPESK